LSDEEKQQSFDKHQGFYRVIDSLISKIEEKFGTCQVFDIHAYNYRRFDRETPVFNLGTAKIDHQKYEKYILHWLNQLSDIKLPNINNVVGENDVFFGRGYFLKYITQKFDKTLVYATEIKKIYCNEETGETYPQVINALKENLKRVILDQVDYFFEQHELANTSAKASTLLSSSLEESVLKVDNLLYELVDDFELLSFVNPVNLASEKKRFFQSKYVRTNPKFHYKHILIDQVDFNKRLYSIPIGSIKDIDIQQMYQDVIFSYANKVEMLCTIGTPDFLYNSLRYFGEPNENDLNNARYLLQTPVVKLVDEDENLSPDQVKEILEQTILDYGFPSTVEFSENIPSQALALKNEKKVLLKKNTKFSLNDAKILANHEVGIHLLTTFNSDLQPVKLFKLGLPLYTMTQEGLAIFSEYMAGVLNINRLRELALRTVAITFMLKGYDFRRTFLYLVEEYKMDLSTAFDLCVRVFRGGGFTKDYLYLRGFREILRLYRKKQPIQNLLIGKTSIEYLSIIDEMVERKLISAPQHNPFSFVTPKLENGILNYVISGIK